MPRGEQFEKFEGPEDPEGAEKPQDADERFDLFGLFEERFPDALSSAAAGFPSAPPDLAHRALVRGRRLRRARVTQVVGAAAVALTLVGFGTYAGLDGGNGTPESVDPAASGARTASRGASPTDSPRVGQTRTPGPPVSDEDMAATLKSLMPKGGSVTDVSGHGSAPGGDGQALTAGLTYHSARGTSAVDVSLARLDPGTPYDQQGYAGCLPVEVRPYDVCTTKTLSDGSSLSTTKSFTYPNSTAGQKRWYAVLTTRDGGQVFAEEFGGGGEKDSTSGVQPALSMDQLSAVAASTAWRTALDSIPLPPVAQPTDPQAGVPNGAQMTAALSALLPKVGSRSDWDADTGRVAVVYNDGHGKTMVAVDAQQGMSDVASDLMNCASVNTYCKITELPDGTLIKESKEPSEKGGSAVVWLVDTLHPDGRRVAVREVNSYAESGPVSRPKPALTLEQLRAVALSPRWLAR